MSPDYKTEQEMIEKQGIDETQDEIPAEPYEFDLLITGWRNFDQKNRPADRAKVIYRNSVSNTHSISQLEEY